MSKFCRTFIIVTCLFLTSIVHSDEQSKLKVVLDKFYVFCNDLSINCDQVSSVDIVLTDDPIKHYQESVPGKISADGSTIFLWKNAKNIESVLFHELVHWAHYAQHSNKWFQKPKYFRHAWLVEVIPFLASLIYLEDSKKLTQAEVFAYTKKLSANLFDPPLQHSPFWFGTIGLWTRYLYHHVKEPKLLLKKWIEISDKDIEATSDWQSVYDLTEFTFNHEQDNLLPTSVKKFENIYNYFILSLWANTQQLDSWNLYYLGFDLDLQVNQDRFMTLSRNHCLDLQPFEFFYAHTNILTSRDNLSFSFDSGIRFLLWRGYQMPFITEQSFMSSEVNSKIRAWDKVVIYNASVNVNQFCVN